MRCQSFEGGWIGGRETRREKNVKKTYNLTLSKQMNQFTIDTSIHIKSML
jgi:hypothetical protein